MVKVNYAHLSVTLFRPNLFCYTEIIAQFRLDSFHVLYFTVLPVSFSHFIKSFCNPALPRMNDSLFELRLKKNNTIKTTVLCFSRGDVRVGPKITMSPYCSINDTKSYIFGLNIYRQLIY